MTKRGGVGLVAVVLAGLAGATGLTGCGGHPAAVPSPSPSASSSPAPTYDPSLPPAQAVLSLVPHDATTLALTDFDQVRAQYGAEPGDPSFWKRASAQSPLLSTDMLRSYAAQLHGFTPDDVAWEAHYAGGDASTTGWVLGFSDGTDMSAVQKAVDARVGPLAGAVVDADAHVVASQRLSDTDPRWTDLADLVGPEAESTYVARGCLPGDTQGQRLQPLDAYAVSFGETLATAYLGPDRDDLFTRMRLGDSIPAFHADFANGAADPSTGRIGYTMLHPVDAAQQALRRKLPFAICAD
jgi:hypothetical protein